jgi:hypothetical protein
MDWDNAVVPAAITVVLIVFVSSVTSCTESYNAGVIEKTKGYIAAGCERKPVVGAVGTHWVCEGKVEG